MIDDSKKIGIGLTAFGILFTCLGMLLFFDKGLIAMGNILFLAGVAMTIGTSATLAFFLRPKNFKGSAFFLGGMLLVIIGWPIIGMILETYGFILLFAGFFPTVIQFLKRIPYVGKLLDSPAFKTAWSTCSVYNPVYSFLLARRHIQAINRVAPASAETLPI